MPCKPSHEHPTAQCSPPCCAAAEGGINVDAVLKGVLHLARHHEVRPAAGGCAGSR